MNISGMVYICKYLPRHSVDEGALVSRSGAFYEDVNRITACTCYVLYS